MDIVEAVKTRRSIRRYEPRDVPKEIIVEILQLALNAPSAGNRQPWRIHVVRDYRLKELLTDAAGGQMFIMEAPWVICVVAVPEESASRYGERGRSLYCIQDTAALITHILLLARNYGLDTCWVGAFDEKKVAEVLNLPVGHRCVAIIPIGYAGEPRKDRPRKSLSEIAVFHE
ncbi:nitroreductase family protein [Pseudothermotoga thermarum]|uniref:Nitroreductase n=1 Tax=Pseudothermotoga thermarum DSM 5069 TaxID=688269 RepID=F7YWC7_9THEM|nr:nitroreductase family protein [Pseudothermotoga thermarum]AEH51905.1 nitroreductase [Pseudothermotoga thermarum DSM 5069]